MKARSTDWTCFPYPSVRQVRYIALIHGGSFVDLHRDSEDSVGVYNLLITAVWALCFVTKVFIYSCAICFGDHLDSYAAFAGPCSNSLNHKFGPPKTSCGDPNMGINPNIGTTCYRKEGVTKTSDFGPDLIDLEIYVRGRRCEITLASERTTETRCMTSTK